MTDTTGPSDTVLDELPPRALKLMGAVSTNPYIRAVLAKRGYTLFLDRLDALENGEDRVPTRDADHAALAKLAARGIDSDERTRLRELLAVAQGSPTTDEAPPSIKPDPKAEADRRQARLDLYAFFNEWSEIARADIKRRDHLIQLGLAKRKVAKKKAAKRGEPMKDEPKKDEPKGGDSK
jgi:hypothetical protein